MDLTWIKHIERPLQTPCGTGLLYATSNEIDNLQTGSGKKKLSVAVWLMDIGCCYIMVQRLRQDTHEQRAKCPCKGCSTNGGLGENQFHRLKFVAGWDVATRMAAPFLAKKDGRLKPGKSAALAN